MAKKIITIDVDEAKGTFTVETTGFQGVGCMDIQRAFETMGTVITDKKTSEYFDKPKDTCTTLGR